MSASVGQAHEGTFVDVYVSIRIAADLLPYRIRGSP